MGHFFIVYKKLYVTKYTVLVEFFMKQSYRKVLQLSALFLGGAANMLFSMQDSMQDSVFQEAERG